MATFFAADAFAHVVLTPFSGTSGAPHQFFSVIAPTEKDIPCVELRIEFPREWKDAGGHVDRVQLDPLWEYSLERDEDNWVKSVTWTGSQAPADAFIKFDMIMSLPKLAGMQQIKAFQTYSDGSVVSWVEDRTEEGVEKPAAGVMLTERSEGERPGGAEGGTSMLSLGLSGILGGLIGAGVVLVVRRSS
jgi:hypothetical protein